jgi:hypothetical protein
MTAGVLAPLARGRSLRPRAAACARRSPAAWLLVPLREPDKQGPEGEPNVCSTKSSVAFGFQFLLGHPDGVPADPGMLVTAMPSWKVRDGERSTFFYWERGNLRLRDC